MELGLLDREVAVQLPGGKLTVSWQGGDERVWLGGPTATVFDGSIVMRGELTMAIDLDPKTWRRF